MLPQRITLKAKEKDMDTNALSVFSYNGNDISFNTGDGIMVNATEMAKPFGKKPNDWLNNQQTKELIATLSSKSGIPDLDLVKVNYGGSNPGTWLHEDLALIFAQWLSPDFYIWCNDRIKELLMKGYVIANPDSFERQNELLDLKSDKLQLQSKINELQEKNMALQSQINGQKLKDEERKVNLLNYGNSMFAEKMRLEDIINSQDNYMKDFFVRFYNVQINYGHLLQVKKTAKAIFKLLKDIEDLLNLPDPDLPNFKETKEYYNKVKKANK